MDNIRSFPRLNLACEIEYSLKSTGGQATEEKVTTQARDISLGGICLITQIPLNKGDILHLQFKLQGKEKPIEIVGKVMWTQTFSIGDQKGYDNGIEFIKINEEDKVIIEEFIQQMISI